MTALDLRPFRHDDARAWRTAPISGVQDFHRSLPGYEPTRLVRLPQLAAELGVGEVFVKEESSRLGLPAFKILGASYAIARLLTRRLSSEAALPVDELHARLGESDRPPLVAATDGNHGRAVARVARLVGLRARIHTPADISAEAKRAIEDEGAERIEHVFPYDDVVRAAAADADTVGGLLIQDTSWDGYHEVPQWIVDGYSTLVEEADSQLAAAGVHTIDLVAVPVGVGSLAQAVVQHYRSGADAPSVLGVEPDAAPAILTSLHGGRATSVPTRPTIMAGLNCGTPSEIGWPVLLAGMDRAVAVTDVDTATAVRDLERWGVDAGPCGAATLAGVRNLRDIGGLPRGARILLLSTEGRRANPLPTEDA